MSASNPSSVPARRLFVAQSGRVTLSAAALGLLSGTAGLARAQSSAATAADVGILNVALGLEHEAINAYQLGAGSGLLQKAVLDVAVAFQSHHKALATRWQPPSRRWAAPRWPSSGSTTTPGRSTRRR